MFLELLGQLTPYLRKNDKERHVLEGTDAFPREEIVLNVPLATRLVYIISRGGTMLARFTVPLENIQLFI
jgi:hypothetical protein